MNNLFDNIKYFIYTLVAVAIVVMIALSPVGTAISEYLSNWHITGGQQPHPHHLHEQVKPPQ